LKTMNLQSIQVNLGTRSYPIYIEAGLMEKLGEHIPSSGRRALVTTSNIFEIYGERAVTQLGDCMVLHVPDGEEAKQWSIAEDLLGRLIEAGFDRKSTLIALGGGSVGDLTGFVASIFLRGVDVIQIPTTLLSMVDSSIGGKTAVNHPKGKNLVGSYHQPSKVLIDPTLLETLPERETQSGLAEVIKYGIISDGGLFKYLEMKVSEKLTIDDLVDVITSCASTKARFVEVDEYDRKGIRAALNLGHTLGHAVETLSSHEVNHGEAVSIGMVTTSLIALRQGLISRIDYQRIIYLIKEYGLPLCIPDLETVKIIEVMRRDKKADKGRIRFVLPTGIGKTPVLRDVDDETIRITLEENKECLRSV